MPEDLAAEIRDRRRDRGPESVRVRFAALEGKADRVLIQISPARLGVALAVIDAVLDALEPMTAAARPRDDRTRIWTGEESPRHRHVPRDGSFRAQNTAGLSGAWPDPQPLTRLKKGDAADDVEIALAAGLDVAIVPGEEANLKITTAGDFARAETLLGGAMRDIRAGNGYDVHRFGPGTHVTLCGVDIPFDRGLQGHSDADVAMHALTDAIYGALADGDIGRHFPPSDPRWKGAASRIFLDHACTRARERGFRIANGDVTIVCEHPKIGPHAPAMGGANRKESPRSGGRPA